MLQGKYPLLIALVLGLFAGIIAYSAIKAKERAVTKPWQTKRILCAAEDIDEGTDLEEAMIAVCDIPERFVSRSFIEVPEGDAENALMPVGQRVIVPLKAGDPVMYSHFESQRDFALSEAIPEKARAIAIDVTEKSSVNQLIRANDHVDLLGTFRDTETRELVAVTLLRNIIVLAAGRCTGNRPCVSEDDRRFNQVVLLTLPEEAEIIALAQESGTLTLTLRNPRDMEEDLDGGRKLKTDTTVLLGGERSAALEKKREQAFQPKAPVVKSIVEEIKGTRSNRPTAGGVLEQ